MNNMPENGPYLLEKGGGKMLASNRMLISGNVTLIEIPNRPFYRFAVVAEQMNRDNPFRNPAAIYGTVTFNKNKGEIVADSLNILFGNLESSTQQWITKRLLKEIDEYHHRQNLLRKAK